LNLQDAETVGAYLNGPVARLVRFFEADVERAGKAAAAASQGASNGGGQEEIPADREGLAPAATAPSDESIPF
jgi:hypothetical protein